MNQRFQFTIDVAANPAQLVALTQATQKQTAAGQQLTAATAATTQALATQEATAKRLSQIHLPEPAMVLEQRKMQAAAASARISREAHATMLRNIEQERQARLRMGAEWTTASRKGSMGQGGASNAAMGGMNGGAALLAASQGLEDAQYGLSGMINNLPGLIMMLGGGAGLAGALSVAAVGANQLWKALGDGASTSEAVVKAKMESIEGILTASMDAMSERIRKRFEDDLNAAQAAAEQKLKDSSQSLAGLAELGRKNEEAAAAKAAAQNAALDTEGAIAGAGGTDAEKADVQKSIQARAGMMAEEAARKSLDEKALAAKQARQIAEQGVANAEQVRWDAEGVNGPQGQNAARSREEILQGMRNNGTVSDQEMQIKEYEEAKRLREGFGTDAARYEKERDDLGPMGRFTSPLKWIQANRQAKYLRGQAATAADVENRLQPTVGVARDQVASGDVSYEEMKKREGSMPSWQRAGFVQGTAALDAQKQREELARKNAQEADVKYKQAQEEVKEAKKKEEQANAARESFEVQRQNDRVGRGELPDMAPEEYGQLAGRQRSGAGMGDAPMLPGATGFQAPDLSGTEQAFSQAMDQTSTAVNQTMERIVSAVEKMASQTGSSLSSLEGRLSGLEGRLNSVKGGQF
ncbi:MAG: hypothetical protein V4662_12120 [Verrucomicrobiota bacterium]